jgi:hypothetical protein
MRAAARSHFAARAQAGLDPIPTEIGQAQFVPGIHLALQRGPPQPVCPGALVAGRPLTVQQAIAEAVHGVGILVRYGCLLVPAEGFAQIAGHPLAEIEQVAQLQLGVEHRGSLAVPDDGLGDVD